MLTRTLSALPVRILPLAAAILIAGAVPAAAQQSEPTGLQQILGKLGLLEIPDDPIDYRERAPLVVPPSNVLVQPADPGDISRNNPDWPIDHDIQRRRAVDPEQERKETEIFFSGRPLRPDELQPRTGSAARGGQPGSAPMSAAEQQERGQEVLSPSQLGFRGWGAKEPEKPTVFTGEPARYRLTQPPSSLFRPSPEAPYGVVTKGGAKPKASTLYDRTGSQGDPAGPN